MNLTDYRLVWLDLETTGLEAGRDTILEVGCIVTDGNLKELARFQKTVYTQATDLQKMCPKVHNMHKSSGLLKEVDCTFETLAEVDRALSHFIYQLTGGEAATLYGNTIHFDRRFIIKSLPLTEQTLGYRMVDVSSFKIAMKMYKDFGTRKKNAHRAVEDCLESIDEYRQILTELKLLDSA